jgi:hypothetical protein
VSIERLLTDHGTTILIGLAVATGVLAFGGPRGQALGRALVKTIFIVPVPLLLFLVSLMIVPESKDRCLLGEFDCFQAGKVVLAPVALWAVAALYAVDVLQRSPPPRWAVWGIVSGAALSAASLAHFLIRAIALLPASEPGSGPLALIAASFPAYVTAWYVLRTRSLVRDGWLRRADAPGLVAVNVPFWAGTAWASREIYARLPEHAATCFVVTAATQGHRAVVGPLVEVAPGRHATAQLLRFWGLEARWRRAHPASHRAVRRLYDRVGPRIAKRVRTRWQADVVYLALKPLELVAALIEPKHRRAGRQ